jgi:hypothetical protein
MSCAKIFTEKEGEFNLMQVVTPPREQGIAPHSDPVKMAANAAVGWLQAKMNNDKITLSGNVENSRATLSIPGEWCNCRHLFLTR